MKKVSFSDKFSVLLAFCDDDKREELDQFLTRKKLKHGIIFMGKGTAESEIADIFGFGLSDKLILATLVPMSIQEKIIKDLTDMLGIEKESFGLTMLLEVSATSSSVLDLMNIDYDTKGEGNGKIK